jgi:hypothetical protein
MVFTVFYNYVIFEIFINLTGNLFHKNLISLPAISRQTIRFCSTLIRTSACSLPSKRMHQLWEIYLVDLSLLPTPIGLLKYLLEDLAIGIFWDIVNKVN